MNEKDMSPEKFTKLIKGKQVESVIEKEEDWEMDHHIICFGDGDHEYGNLMIKFTDGTYIALAGSEWAHASYYIAEKLPQEKK
jgi:hypothetical protein